MKKTTIARKGWSFQMMLAVALTVSLAFSPLLSAGLGYAQDEFPSESTRNLIKENATIDKALPDTYKLSVAEAHSIIGVKIGNIVLDPMVDEFSTTSDELILPAPTVALFSVGTYDIRITFPDHEEEGKLSFTDSAPASGGDYSATPFEDADREEESAEDEASLENSSEVEGAVPFSDVSPAGDKLTFEVSNASGGYDDVDDINNAMVWPLSTKQKTITVDAAFAPESKGDTRTVTITVPQGYKITSYSTKAADAAITTDGVIKNAFSELYDAAVSSVSLTDLAGEDWASQRLGGYSNYGSAVSSDYRTRSGIVTYTFNEACQNIKLTLTLELDQKIMPHNAGTTVLDPLTVDMVSGENPLSANLTTTVSELATTVLTNPGIPHYGDRSIEGNPTTGQVAEFITATNTKMQNTATGSQNHYADKIVYTVSYPEGVSFQGFEEELTGNTVKKGSLDGLYYDGAHLSVEHDASSRTVTFLYDKVTVAHATQKGPFFCYWTADMNVVTGSTWDGSSTDLVFANSYTETSGGGVEKSTEHAASLLDTTIKVLPPAWKITTWAYNETRVDLNALNDWSKNYYLGGFYVENEGPSIATNLTYTYTFDEALGVRAVSFPGIGSTNNIYGVVAEVKGGSQGAHTITLPGKEFVTNSESYHGTMVKDDASGLGLEEGEYIVKITAQQKELAESPYPRLFTHGASSYYGSFQGASGVATLTIEGEGGFSTSAVDQTTLGHEKTAGGILKTGVSKKEGSSTTSLHPGDAITVSSTYEAAPEIQSLNEIIDPTVIISLPAGIELDEGSVKAVSSAGNKGTDAVSLEMKNVFTQTIQGVEWKTYHFTSKDRYDMVALSYNTESAATSIKVFFDANILSTCPAYGEVALKDIVLWDIGPNTVKPPFATSYVVADEGDRSGNGTDYALIGGTQSGQVNVIQSPAFLVDSGIRTSGSTSDYYTYFEGDSTTIAPVTPEEDAEVWLRYRNTSNIEYQAGSVIYLPIPKQGIEYDNFFYEVAHDPFANEKKVFPTYNMSLKEAIDLPGFTTYYSTHTGNETNSLSSGENWTPLDDDLYRFSTTPPANLANVTMVKFVADANIAPMDGSDPSAGTGETSFNLAIDSGAKLGQVNYLRSFQKGKENPQGSGVWSYGAVIAATPAKAGIEGKVFIDEEPHNGIMDSTESVYDNTAGKLSAVLTGDTINALPMTIGADGSFKSLNPDSSAYYLGAGTYKVTITNNDPSYGFTSVSSSTRSDGTNWYMDIPQAKIAADHRTAVFDFTVEAGATLDTLSTEYLGVGLGASHLLNFVAGEGVIGFGADNSTLLTDYAASGSQISLAKIPTLSAANAESGRNYNSNAQSWVLDKDVELYVNGGANETKPAGTALTRAELARVIVTESLTATLNIPLNTYTITTTVVDEAITGGTATASASPVVWDSSSTITAAAATGYELDYMTVNGTAVAPTPISVSNINSYTYTIDNIQENKNVIVKYKLEPVVPDDGLKIAASPFIMSIAEAQAHEGKSTSEKFAELISRGQATAWWENTLQEVAITWVSVKPLNSSVTAEGIVAIVGDYHVTYTAQEKGKTASVTVLATVYDNTASGADIGGNNFSWDYAWGEFTSDSQVRENGNVTVYDQWGVATDEKASLASGDRQKLNNARNALKYNQSTEVWVTFKSAAGKSVSLKVTIYRGDAPVTPIVPPVIPPVTPTPITPIVPPATTDPGTTPDTEPGEEIVAPTTTNPNSSSTPKKSAKGASETGLDDSSVPLGGLDAPEHWSLLSLLLVIVGVIMSVVHLVLGLRRRKGKENDEEEVSLSETQGATPGFVPAVESQEYDEKEREAEAKRSMTIPRLIALLVGFAAVIVLLILEDYTLSVAWINQWTIVFIVMFIVEIVCTLIHWLMNRKPKDEEPGEDPTESITEGATPAVA